MIHILILKQLINLYIYEKKQQKDQFDQEVNTFLKAIPTEFLSNSSSKLQETYVYIGIIDIYAKVVRQIPIHKLEALY